MKRSKGQGEKEQEARRAPHTEEIGETRAFVLAQGFERVGAHTALIGEDGSKRLFAELTADRDRPDVRPAEAYQAILTSMQPGWTLRFLQLYWPDPAPRQAFHENVLRWPQPPGEGLAILRDGLLLALDETGLPYGRRTFIEFVFQGEESLAWWEGLGGVCRAYGVHIRYLDQERIQALAHWMFNPSLE